MLKGADCELQEDFYEISSSLDQCGNYCHTDRTGSCWYGESADRERGANERRSVSSFAVGTFGCLQCARGPAVFHSRGRQYSVSKNGWFRRFVYGFIRLVSMDEVDAEPAEYPDAESVHEFRSRT